MTAIKGNQVLLSMDDRPYDQGFITTNNTSKNVYGNGTLFTQAGLTVGKELFITTPGKSVDTGTVGLTTDSADITG
ncbi:hypothetical protein, partial [Oenococcus oeni]|uniref:hypothetical protein n=1 Tax=Oenococcus oeni TaxID=1247 RepID=UPI00117D6981